MRAGCVFVAGIHPSRTWTSGSFESVRWNACVHRLGLGLYSHSKEFWGEWVWTHVNSKGKIPFTGKCPQRGIEPGTLWTASPNTTNELFRPPSRTASPTHYQRAIPAPVYEPNVNSAGSPRCKKLLIKSKHTTGVSSKEDANDKEDIEGGGEEDDDDGNDEEDWWAIPAHTDSDNSGLYQFGKQYW